MKTHPVFKLAVLGCVFALSLGVVAGCSQAGSGAASSSAQADSASASASASAASTEQASSDAQDASAQSDSAVPSGVSSESEQQQISMSSDAGKVTAENAASLGYQVFAGEVRVVSAAELVALQKADIDPAIASNGGTYAVLVFGQPSKVNGMSGDGLGQRTETSNMMGIAEHTDYDGFVIDYGNLDSWRDLDGQQVTLAVRAEDIMFPSDVRLPLGEPSASSVTML